MEGALVPLHLDPSQGHFEHFLFSILYFIIIITIKHLHQQTISLPLNHLKCSDLSWATTNTPTHELLPSRIMTPNKKPACGKGFFENGRNICDQCSH
jgi:hypothetical protein